MVDKQIEEKYFNLMQKGDVGAFEYFFREYMHLLYSYALGFMKEKEAAEDIVQDVFVYFWNNKERIRYTGSILGYLQRAVKNACVNVRLHEQVKRKYVQEALYTEEEALDWQRADALREMRQRLLEAVDQLPEKCKQIFMMSCLEGLKYKEVARQMGISENTVKTQIKLAYKRLREGMNVLDENAEFILVLVLFYY